MALNVARVRQCLQNFDFRALFIQELGWDKHSGTLLVAVEGQTFSLQPVAEKRGFQVFECPPGATGSVPDHPTRSKIERQVAKSAHEHIIIYTDTGKTAQKWQWVRRQIGRPLARREYDFFKGNKGELLAQRLQYLAVDLAEEEKLTLVDVNRLAQKHSTWIALPSDSTSDSRLNTRSFFLLSKVSPVWQIPSGTLR